MLLLLPTRLLFLLLPLPLLLQFLQKQLILQLLLWPRSLPLPPNRMTHITVHSTYHTAPLMCMGIFLDPLVAHLTTVTILRRVRMAPLLPNFQPTFLLLLQLIHRVTKKRSRNVYKLKLSIIFLLRICAKIFIFVNTWIH